MKPGFSFLTLSLQCQQRSLVHELAADANHLLRQSVMLAQIFSVCGNLFAKNF
jgi:hypothetical protein